MKKRTFEISLIGLGVVAVATLAFGVAHRAGKARHDAPHAREAEDLFEPGELTAGSAEGEALSSPIAMSDGVPASPESLPRDEAMAEIWGTETLAPDREDVLGLTGDLASELDARGDTYDGIEPEDLGAEWLARATEAPLHQLLPHRGGALTADEALLDTKEEPDPNEVDDDDLDRA